jgi:cytidine deaminase
VPTKSLTAEVRQQLIDAALTARHAAYAPYSKFKVGAAVLAESGEIFSGCNVENASYGLTICAERSAVFAAVAAGLQKFAAVAIATRGGHFPCGACRQVLIEFGDDIAVLLVDADQPAQVAELSLSALLPGKFDGEILKTTDVNQ